MERPLQVEMNGMVLGDRSGFYMVLGQSYIILFLIQTLTKILTRRNITPDLWLVRFIHTVEVKLISFLVNSLIIKVLRILQLLALVLFTLVMLMKVMVM